MRRSMVIEANFIVSVVVTFPTPTQKKRWFGYARLVWGHLALFSAPCIYGKTSLARELYKWRGLHVMFTVYAID